MYKQFVSVMGETIKFIIPFQKTTNESKGDENQADAGGIPAAVKHSIDPHQPANLPSKCDSMHIIRVENIPWTATKWNVVDFFSDIKMLSANKGVHFIIDDDSNHNDIFIELASSADYQLAMNHKAMTMGYSTVNGWYISCTLYTHRVNEKLILCLTVTAADIDAFMDLVNQPTYPSNQRMLRFKELPSNCSAQDIREFFKGLLIF